MSTPLLEVKDLQKRYPIYGPLGKLFRPKTYMNAVSGMSLQLYEGETYGLVGESGCGKTTTGRAILGLVKPDGGEIWYRGHDLTKLSDQEFRPLRRELQLVFQDPLSSLNPRQRIGALLEEPLIVQGMGDAESRRAQVMDILEKVGLSEEHYFRYPHELSGGQVQRLGIARAPDHRPPAHCLRRAGLRPGRVHPGPDSQYAHPAAAGDESESALYLPRHRRGAVSLPPHRRDVPGFSGGRGRHRRPLCPASAPLYPGAVCLGARPGQAAPPPPPWRESSPSAPTNFRAAYSTPAALTPLRSAAAARPPCGKFRAAIRWPAIAPVRPQWIKQPCGPQNQEPSSRFPGGWFFFGRNPASAHIRATHRIRPTQSARSRLPAQNGIWQFPGQFWYRSRRPPLQTPGSRTARR